MRNWCVKVSDDRSITLAPQAKELESSYEVFYLDGKKVLFSNLGVNREKLPKELFTYDIQHSDSGFEACAIRNVIAVNHYGSLITKEPIELDETGWRFLEDGDLDESYYGSMTIEDYMSEQIEEMTQEMCM